VSGERRLSYGWVIVGAVTVMIGVTYGLMFSYSVFFKPLADYFGWDRATVSLVYSASLVIRGAAAIGIGWLADRYGARKMMAFCGLMVGGGLVLSSQVHTLWQLFLTYAVVEAIGLSGAFGIGTAAVSRWFTERRGLALGIASAGSGLGTLLIVPGNERLINAFDWNGTFLITGVAAGILFVVAALLLRPPPLAPATVSTRTLAGHRNDFPQAPPVEKGLGAAIKDPRMRLLLAAFGLFFFSIQIIMTHLVNYATDLGIDPLVAATFISIIGAVSIASRLSSGIGADRIGIHNTLILTRVFLVLSFVIIFFTGPLWSFYLFALAFGLPYGGEIPQIPLYVGRYFGDRDLATLVGLCVFVTNIGGALGPWLAGKIFDLTRSYDGAFIAGGLAGLISLAMVLALKRMDRPLRPDVV
jgi:MFS transporter, OFA family, oxalate/formate antiporter